jgi:hypothetical protein
MVLQQRMATSLYSLSFPKSTGLAGLKRAKTKIWMDGKAQSLDIIFVERLWRPRRYECVTCALGRLSSTQEQNLRHRDYRSELETDCINC